MTPAKLAEYKKALGALLGLIASGALALSALQFLNGPASHDLAIVAAVASALLVPLGAALPTNGPKSQTAIAVEDLIDEVTKTIARAEAVKTAVLGSVPVATKAYAPSLTQPETVIVEPKPIGGVVEAGWGRIDVLLAVTWIAVCGLSLQIVGLVLGVASVVIVGLYRNHLVHVAHDAAVRRAVGRRCTEIGMYSTGGAFHYPTRAHSDAGADRLRRSLDSAFIETHDFLARNYPRST